MVTNEEIKKLIEAWHLFGFEKVKYRPCGFLERDRFDYATLEIITSEPLTKLESIVRMINPKLTLEEGFRASVRKPIGMPYKSNGKKEYKYIIEIVPFDYVLENQWEDATKDVIKGLSKILKNISMRK